MTSDDLANGALVQAKLGGGFSRAGIEAGTRSDQSNLFQSRLPWPAAIAAWGRLATAQ